MPREANLDPGEEALMCRKVLITLGIVVLLCAANARADDAYAYCPLGEGYVFLYDSLTGFQVIANLKCGQRVTVVDARDRDRVKVHTADGKDGYVLKSSITATAPGGQRQPATPPNAGSSQPQAQPQPPAQPQPQQPQQPKIEPQAQPQPQPQTAPVPSQTAPVQPQTEPASQPETEPKPQLQTLPQPRPQAQLQVELTPVEPVPQAESLVQPEPEPQPELRPQPQPQPQPAATAFTPFSTFGYGQNVPRLEVFGGFSYLNAQTPVLSPSRQNVLGFEGSVSINANKWLAGEANFSGYYKTIDILGVATVPFHDYSAMAGPRFNMHKAFFHALVGIDHLVGSANFYAVNAASSANVLAGAAGGGVQWNVTRQLALRTSADYVMSRFGGVMQNNFRVTLGIVFEAGSVKNRGE